MRALLAALAVLFLVTAPAAAQDKICHGQLAPPTPEQQEQSTLQHYAEQRASFGFRHDIPYIKELIKRGVWEYDVGYIPVTPRENVYLRLHDRLELGPRAERYLRAHRDIDAGGSIEEGWPKEPYLMVRVTRDRAQHLAALKRLARFPDNLKVVLARYSTRELDQLTDRVWDDQKTLAAAGFTVVTTGISAVGNFAEVELITKRADARAYFAKRYGQGLKATVIGTETTRLECNSAGSYEIAPDGLSLTVHWGTGGGTKLERIEVTESAERVDVGVVERGDIGPRTDELNSRAAPVALSAPLGARAVFDAATGKRMLQRGPSPGDPPCPAPRGERTQLEQAIETRQERGLRADPAYVQARLNSRSFYTKAEQRWLAKREALDSQSEVHEYLQKHADEYGGSTLGGPFPAEPFIVFHFTAHRARHEAALKRLSDHPDRVRSDTVQYTETEIRHLSERIRNDADAAGGFLDGYGRAGFYVTHAYGEAQTVIVLLKTTRPDHQAYFTARYGPLVRTEVEGDRFECVPLDR